MKFSKLLLAIIVGSEIFSEVVSAGKVSNHKPHKKRYRILTPKGIANITDIDDDADLQRIDFISVFLTDEQAENLRKA